MTKQHQSGLPMKCWCHDPRTAPQKDCPIHSPLLAIPEPAQSEPDPDLPLLLEITAAIMDHLPRSLADDEQRAVAAGTMADAVMSLLNERGHYLPGGPPAAEILKDAKSFAERLTLSNLALRILNMLSWSGLVTPESKPARKWLEDYMEGKNHGPVGHPMLWPGRLPGMAQMLSDWGFMPTPTTPAYVARVLSNPTIN